MNNMGIALGRLGGAAAAPTTKLILLPSGRLVRTFLIGVEDSMTEDAPKGSPEAAAAGFSTQLSAVPSPKPFHLHLVSDASGETLTTMAKAAAVQISEAKPNRHMHPLVRNQKQLSTVLQQIEAAPGIVLYTLMNPALAEVLEAHCAKLNLPCVAVLKPVIEAFERFLEMPSRHVVAGQHTLDADYFRRIEAMNFTLSHDDSQHAEDLEKADIVLVGASRTSKTPTSIYLANRGYKTANVSLVPNIDAPQSLEKAKTPFVVGLVASPERIAEIRRNRLLSLNRNSFDTYVDADAIKEEMAATKRLCAKHGWPVVDVTRRSIEETAAAIISLYEDRMRRCATENGSLV
jgi:regulator of PEP synthase PpsR (kinase-PPPase family)